MPPTIHADYRHWSTPPAEGPGAVHMGPIMAWIEETVADDTIFTNGAGNYATWVHRFHRFRRFATQAAPTSGSMGYGVPAAVAAKQLFPERAVICFAGDGCFLMNGQEFATAIQIRLGHRRDRRQQRHLRHDPHASGAGLSRAASAPPISPTPILPPWHAPMAAMAKRSSGPKTSLTPIDARSPPESPRSSRSSSIPKRSRRRARSATSGRSDSRLRTRRPSAERNHARRVRREPRKRCDPV
jgi:hypothetical protein